MEKLQFSKQMEYIHKRLKKLEQQERKLVEKQENIFLKKKIAPLKQKINDKIPEKMQTAFQSAFDKAFRMLFKSGGGIIEKTYSKRNQKLKFKNNQAILKCSPGRKNVQKFGMQADQTIWKNHSIAACEGAVLGILGIGLPDIPIFLGVILKTIYEIGLSFGYGNEKEEESLFALLVILIAVSEKEEAEHYIGMCHSISASEGKNNIVEKCTMKELINITSKKLSEKILLAKFVQGITIIGVSGLVTNVALLNSISSVAKLEYEKRFLSNSMKSLRMNLLKTE